MMAAGFGLLVLGFIMRVSLQKRYAVGSTPVGATPTTAIQGPSGTDAAAADPTGTPSVVTTSQPIPNSTLPLQIREPLPGATMSESRLVVKGKTSARADVFLNDQEAKADANGNFSIAVTLDEGDNTLVIVVTDQEGNFAEREITVTYTPGE